MRFVQLADIHLDSTIGGALNLPDEKKAALRQDIRDACSRAFALAAENNSDLVLIPGDLFDFEAVRPDTSAFLRDLFSSIAPIKVFITPGNHDSLRPGNPYTSAHNSWPDNVHIFTSPSFESVELPELGCAITGIAHAHRGVTDRVLSQASAKSSQPINLLLFHGSRDGYKPSEKETVIPFSDSELINQSFTYSAIGHYHSLSLISDGDGCVKGAYSGCVQGRGLDETGEKCVLLGEIDSAGRVRLEPVEVAPRRIICAEVDVTGAADNNAVLARIDAALQGANVRSCDIASITLKGALAASVRIDTSKFEASGDYFHISINRSQIEPEYDIKALMADSAASSLKSEFVRKMLEMQNVSNDPGEQQAIKDALNYGLYALDGRELEPKDAN